jgi:hypothetical protein
VDLRAFLPRFVATDGLNIHRDRQRPVKPVEVNRDSTLTSVGGPCAVCATQPLLGVFATP